MSGKPVWLVMASLRNMKVPVEMPFLYAAVVLLIGSTVIGLNRSGQENLYSVIFL